MQIIKGRNKKDLSTWYKKHHLHKQHHVRKNMKVMFSHQISAARGPLSCWTQKKTTTPQHGSFGSGSCWPSVSSSVPPARPPSATWVVVLKKSENMKNCGYMMEKWGLYDGYMMLYDGYTELWNDTFVVFFAIALALLSRGMIFGFATPFWLRSLSWRLSPSKPIKYILTLCKVGKTRFNCANHFHLSRELSQPFTRRPLSRCFPASFALRVWTFAKGNCWWLRWNWVNHKIGKFCGETIIGAQIWAGWIYEWQNVAKQLCVHLKPINLCHA